LTSRLLVESILAIYSEKDILTALLNTFSLFTLLNNVYLPTPPGMGRYTVETIKINVGCNIR
jgi:hypothetical protein